MTSDTSAMPKHLHLTLCKVSPRIELQNASEKTHIGKSDFSNEDAWSELQSTIYNVFGVSSDEYALKIHPIDQCGSPFTKESFGESFQYDGAYEVEFRKIAPDDDEDEDENAPNDEDDDDHTSGSKRKVSQCSDSSGEAKGDVDGKKRKGSRFEKEMPGNDGDGDGDGHKQGSDNDANGDEDGKRDEDEKSDKDEHRNEDGNSDKNENGEEDESRDADENGEEDEKDEDPSDLEARERPKGLHVFNLGRQPGQDFPTTNDDEISHQAFVVAICHDSENIEICTLNAWQVNDLIVGNYENRTEISWKKLNRLYDHRDSEVETKEYELRFEPNEYFATAVANGTLPQVLAQLFKGETHEDIPQDLDRRNSLPPIWPIPTDGSPPDEHADGGGSGPIAVVYEFVNDSPAKDLGLPVNNQGELEDFEDFEALSGVVMGTDFSDVGFSTLERMLNDDKLEYWCDLEVWVLPQGSRSEMYSWTENKDMKAGDFMHTMTGEKTGKRQLYIEVWIKKSKDAEERLKESLKEEEATKKPAGKKRPVSTSSTINKKGIAKKKSSTKRQKRSDVDETSKADKPEEETTPPKPASQVTRKSMAKVPPRRHHS